MKYKLFNCTIKINFLSTVVYSFLFYLSPIATILAVCSSMVHEIGHLSAIFFYRFNVKKIEVGVFNFIITSNVSHNLCKNYNYFIFLAGPMFNLLVAIGMSIVNSQNRCYSAELFCIDNWCLFLLNILPVKGLDGGNILYTLLIKKLDNILADKIINIISLLVAFVLAFVGIYIMYKQTCNFSLFTLSLCLMYNIILKYE